MCELTFTFAKKSKQSRPLLALNNICTVAQHAQAKHFQVKTISFNVAQPRGGTTGMAISLWHNKMQIGKIKHDAVTEICHLPHNLRCCKQVSEQEMKS